MTGAARHLRALLGSTVRDFFVEDTGYWNDNNESIKGVGAGGGIFQSQGDDRGADMPDWLSDNDLSLEEFREARGGGIFYVCRPTGYMEDTI